MKVDTITAYVNFSADPQSFEESCKKMEDFGFDGIFTAETGHDPFFPLLFAAKATTRPELGTAIAVAFARNPMTVAILANDLQLYSKGRFVLGLGSQIKAHITRRFSMPWSKPAARMREFIQAMRAIWDCWNEGKKLDFKGEFYTHTLMTPFFSPGRNPYGPPRVALAGVGPLMTEVAAEVCDGFIMHGFTTREYFLSVTLPAIEKGLAKAGKSRADFEIFGPSFFVTGANEAEVSAAAALVRQQIAFYGSTPAYKGVFEAHGWGDLQPELHRLTREGRWGELGSVIDDEVLATFAVIAEPQDLAKKFAERWGGLVDRVTFPVPFERDPDLWGNVLEELKKVPDGRSASSSS